MQVASIPEFEKKRIETLNEYRILDTVSEQHYDDITNIAASICGTSISLVSFVDSERQWFKSRIGLEAQETHRDVAFCAHAILQEDVFEVQDASQDERFFDNPLVTGSPDIRYYAGAPLKAYNGMPLGTLCIIDTEAKKIDKSKIEALKALARQIEAQLELRRSQYKLEVSYEKLKAKNDELIILSKHRTEFLNHVSHEIRTPLNSILGFSNILGERFPYQEDAEEDANENLIHHIQIASEGLSDIVNHVLDISRIEAGKMELDLEHVDIRQMIKEIYLINLQKANDKAIDFTYKVDDEVPQVLHIDKTKVVQILINLIGNAIKFTPSKKKVQIEVSSIDDDMLIKVIDRGIGITQELQKVIFQPFSQIKSIENKQQVGSGLGLTICQELAEFMHGKIWLESIKDVGSNFYVRLPYEIGDPEKISKQLFSYDLKLDGQKLLIIEDNVVNQLVIKAFLKNTNCDIIFASDGTTAIQSYRENMPDLILLDIGLPDMDGFEVIANLKALDEFSETPIIIVSGEVTSHSHKRAKEFNIEFFLNKPVKRPSLYEAIYQALKI